MSIQSVSDQTIEETKEVLFPIHYANKIEKLATQFFIEQLSRSDMPFHGDPHTLRAFVKFLTTKGYN